MKIIRAFLLLPLVAFVACETTRPNGSVSKFDGDALVDGIKATGEAVNQYQQYQQRQQAAYRQYQSPAYQQPVYNSYGQPIYPVTP